MVRTSALEQAFSSLGRITRPAWLFALFASGASAVSDLVYWEIGAKIGWRLAPALIAITAISLGAVYYSAVAISRKRASLWGYFRFAAASLAAVSPIALAVLALIAGKAYVRADARLGLLLSALVGTFLISSLLAGWAMAQSLSRTLISPLRVLRATRGHRGSLIFLSFSVASIGKSDMLPKIETANNLGEAMLIATGNALINTLIIALTAAIAVAAWQFAGRIDPALDPP